MTRAQRSKIALLALGLTAVGLSTGTSFADTLGGSAVPQSFREPPTIIADPTKNPEVMDPKEPEVVCFGDEATASPNAPKCMPQTDAFRRAGEAASYLSHYQHAYSNYGTVMQKLSKDPKAKAEYDQALKDCVNGTDCTKEKQAHMLKALVQYNFGKELKSQMLENESRRRRMSSVENSMTEQDWRQLNAPQGKLLVFRPDKKRYEKDSYRPQNAGSILKTTFKINPKDVHAIDWDKISQAERDQLGVAFNREFGDFVNNYTNTSGKSRWHYVPAITSAVGGGKRYIPAVDIYNRDPRQGMAQIDHPRYDHDSQVQASRNVQEIVSVFKNEYSNVNTKNKMNTEFHKEGDKDFKTQESMKAAMSDMGFGLPNAELEKIGDGPNQWKNPTEVAAAVVVHINNDIYKSEMKNQIENPDHQRVPSSAGIQPVGIESKNRIVSATVDVAEFDKFLDDIWPANFKR